MDSFEFNKIIAAIVLTVVVVLGIDGVSDLFFKVDKPIVSGYKVEIDTASTSTAKDGDSQLCLLYTSPSPRD